MAKKKQDETEEVMDDKLQGVSPSMVIFVDGEEEVQTTIRLPRAVVYALIDPTFEEADRERAVFLGLLDFYNDLPTEFGQRVLDGTDVIALRHKIIRAKKAAQV